MNCFFILLLFFFVQTRCDTVFQNGQDILNADNDQLSGAGHKADVLVSVREYPSELHKCTATFLALDALLTTAKCLYCEDCQLFVHALSSTLTDETQYSKGVTYTIKKTVIHPDYEKSPHENDIGLIQLTTKVPKAVVFGLQATVPEISGLIVETYRWQFSANFREFNLEKIMEQTISNAACSTFFNKYIDYKHVCTRRNESLLLGAFDQGIPIIDRTNGIGTILGIYEAVGKNRKSKIEIYQAVFPHVTWIKKVLACGFKCVTSKQNETRYLPTGRLPTPKTSTEIPFDDRNTSPIVTTISPAIELNEAQEAEIEKKAPNAATDGDRNRNKPSKSANFKPKPLPGKRFF